MWRIVFYLWSELHTIHRHYLKTNRTCFRISLFITEVAVAQNICDIVTGIRRLQIQPEINTDGIGIGIGQREEVRKYCADCNSKTLTFPSSHVYVQHLFVHQSTIFFPGSNNPLKRFQRKSSSTWIFSFKLCRWRNYRGSVSAIMFPSICRPFLSFCARLWAIRWINDNYPSFSRALLPHIYSGMRRLISQGWSRGLIPAPPIRRKYAQTVDSTIRWINHSQLDNAIDDTFWSYLSNG